jgi:hypothetical protein
MREKLRDKSRDELAERLNNIGVKAILSERERPEEKVGNSMFLRSLGVIDITGGPITWASVIKKDQSKDSPARWWIYFGVPDERVIPKDQSIKIKTVRKKAFPIFGKVVDVNWKGQDRGLGLVKTLSANVPISRTATDIGNIEVKSLHDDFQGWTIRIDRRFEPTPERWQSLQSLADILINSVRKF